MHMRRQLRETLVSVLDGIEGVRTLNTHRVAVAAALAAEGQACVIVYPVADLPPQRVNAALQGPRPGYRGFAFGVAVITSDEDAEDGRMDEISEEVERRVFLAADVRKLATRDVVHAGGEVSVLPDDAVALITVYEFHVPMLEGVADKQAF